MPRLLGRVFHLRTLKEYIYKYIGISIRSRILHILAICGIVGVEIRLQSNRGDEKDFKL